MGESSDVQFIMRDGEPEWAVVPYGFFRRLVEMAEIVAVSKSRSQVAVGEIRSQASKDGLDDLSAEQVGEIIQLVRSKHKERDNPHDSDQV